MLLRHFLRRHPPRSPANVVPRGHWRPAALALAGLSPVRGRGTHGWPHHPRVVGWIPPQQPGGMTIYLQGMTALRNPPCVPQSGDGSSTHLIRATSRSPVACKCFLSARRRTLRRPLPYGSLRVPSSQFLLLTANSKRETRN